MRNKILFVLVVVGLASGLLSAAVYSHQPTPPPPVFNPAPDPFASGIYANGIVESYQAHGQNTNLYPEVPGTITAIHVTEGQRVARGDRLASIDDSVQRATTEQLVAQAEAAHAALEQLRAQPRKETLAVARAQVDVAAASLGQSRLTLDKQLRSFQLDPRSISKDTLDNARSTANVAQANLELATRQYELTKAGTWIYDIRNQERQHVALTKSARSAEALLAKYELRAPRDGTVLSVQIAVGSYVSPQGTYNSYTQGFDPIMVMGDAQLLAVRCYVDEILIPRMPDPSRLIARMFIRGTSISVPLQFERVQPYVSPKLQLSNARTEKVDLRVLPVIFRFTPPPGVAIYPGQLVDVYLGEQPQPLGKPQSLPQAAKGVR